MKRADRVSSLLNSRAGERLVAWAARLAYLDPLRRLLFRVVASRLARSGARQGNASPPWHRLHEQYRWIALAVLRSLDRAIEKRVLAPHVARTITGLWARAFFPSRERRAAAERFRRANGSAPPWFLVISPTRACNLNCPGCYANSGSAEGYPGSATLPWDMVDRIMTEAKELWGVRLFVFSGGEPLAYRSQGRDLLDLVARHRDCLFLMFTNGTLVTPEIARRLSELGNLTPALSVEGLEAQTDRRRGEGIFEDVLAAMALLRRAGVPFGISMTATRANCETLLADPLLDFYFQEQGAFYAFIFQYMPIGRFPNLDWLPTPDQRIAFWRRSWEVVRQRRLFLLDFWNHGPLVEGCIAGGRDRGYLHVDWNGDVMPCVFMPYVAANLHTIFGAGGTLNDVWHSPLFQRVRQWQRDYGYGGAELSRETNWLLPCPFRDHFSAFCDWIQALEPPPEPGVAPASLTDGAFREKMLAYEREQAGPVQAIWEAEYMGPGAAPPPA